MSKRNTELLALVSERDSTRSKIQALHAELAKVEQQIKDTCHHPMLVNKQSYTSGGYDYQGEDRDWEECTICGHTQNLKIRFTGFA